MSAPYAPSYTSYGSRVSGLDEEIKLYTTVKQREIYEALAEIYSIIVTLDVVEKAYIKDTITIEEYVPTCVRLLTQYNSILKNVDVANEFDSLDGFKQKYNLTHTHATSRLKIGVPATVEHAMPSDTLVNKNGGTGGGGGDSTELRSRMSSGVSARAVSEATGNFITMMDGLKLNLKAKDQLHPILSELMSSLNKVTNGRDFEGRGKLVEWLIKLNVMKVNEEITEEQARQFLFDLDNAYKSFFATLE